MRKIIIVLLVVAAIIVAGVVAVFFLTAGIVNTADQFFTAVSEDDYSRAYGFLSEEFRATTSEEQLRAFLIQSALASYREAKWHTRSMENDQGLLEGTIGTEDGGTIPVKITLVKESGEWKLLAIQKASAGLVPDGGTKEIPPPDQLNNLVDDSIQTLAQAINAGDFGGFYAGIAKLWQAQTTEEELLTGFRSFVEQDIDLTVLANLEPVFSEEPRLDEDGILYLTGYYPSQPAVTYFELKYVYEHPDWKLFGSGVEVK